MAKKLYQVNLEEELVGEFKQRYGDSLIFWGVLNRFLEIFLQLDKEEEAKGFDRLLRNIGKSIKDDMEVE